MKVRLIHGIHEKEGDNNMSQFAPYVRKAFPGAQVSLFEYGFMGFWAARWENDGVARDLAAMSKLDRGARREVWITHSNGAAIAYLAVEEHGAFPDMIINVNPALDRWLTPAVPAVEVAYSEQDRAVDVSQWLPFHLWGDQGKVGYKGRLLNTISHNATKIGGPMSYKHHCGMFDGARRKTDWAYFWANRVGERLGL